VSVRLTEDEMYAFLADAHTGVLSTLRRDGSPASMPMWFVLLDRDVYIRTLAGSRKTGHMRRDPRVSFLVERGRAWTELQAVVLSGRAVIETDPALTAGVDDAFACKYAGFLMPDAAPDATRRHYAAERVHVRIAVQRTPRTWNNAKLVA
jgi:PPOX class probable F420-dependent enzyme